MLSAQELIFSNEQAIAIILNLIILLFLGIILIINLKKCNRCNNEKDFSLFDWLINQTKSLLQRRKKMKQNKLFVYTKRTLIVEQDKKKKSQNLYSEIKELIFTNKVNVNNIIYEPKLFEEKEYKLKENYHFIYDTLYWSFKYEQLDYDFNDTKISKFLKKYSRRRIYQTLLCPEEYIDIVYRDGVIIGYEFSKRTNTMDTTDYFYFIDEKIKNKVIKELKVPSDVICNIFDKDITFMKLNTSLTKEDYKKKMKKMILKD